MNSWEVRRFTIPVLEMFCSLYLKLNSLKFLVIFSKSFLCKQIFFFGPQSLTTLFDMPSMIKWWKNRTIIYKINHTQVNHSNLKNVNFILLLYNFFFDKNSRALSKNTTFLIKLLWVGAWVSAYFLKNILLEAFKSSNIHQSSYLIIKISCLRDKQQLIGCLFSVSISHFRTFHTHQYFSIN